MTRVNVVPVRKLSDQHLIAEYHELPRVIKQKINICNAPECYVLGTGHVKWACKHWKYVIERFSELYLEMKYRGFTANFPPEALKKYVACLNNRDGVYNVTNQDIELNRQRIKERYNQKPAFYKWTKRPIPKWLQ